jgi:S-adenosylmethionine hydrolase
MSIITLTTDFGLKDHFVGALKGKLISEYPEIQIIDISHEIDLFNIAEASYIINAAYKSFPKGTVHFIGVDSELTDENKHIVMQWNDHYFICADNGILSILTQKIVAQKLVEINIHNRLPTDANQLDVFVKVACHIAKGGALSVIGKEIQQIKVINELQAVVASDFSNIKGYVVYIDHFGNCVTNISKKMFADIGQNRLFEIKFGNKNIKKIHANYSDFKVSEKYTLKDYEGEKLALFNEAGFLEIAIYKSNPNSVGSAKSLLGLKYRDVVNIDFRV